MEKLNLLLTAMPASIEIDGLFYYLEIYKIRGISGPVFKAAYVYDHPKDGRKKLWDYESAAEPLPEPTDGLLHCLEGLMGKVLEDIDCVRWGYLSGAGRELAIPERAIEEICQSGSNDAAVADWRRNPLMQYLMFDIPKDALKACVRETGAKTYEELDAMTLEELQEFVIWTVAWDLFDSE